MARQFSLPFTISQSLLKLMSIESTMPSPISSPIVPFSSCPQYFPVFSTESALHIRWPKYWSFSFNISPSSEYSGLIIHACMCKHRYMQAVHACTHEHKCALQPMHVRAHVYTQLDVHTQTRRCFCVCICFYLNTDDVKVKVLVTQSFLTFCDPVDYSPTGSSDHGILQARILETISFSRGSSPARNQTWVSTKPGFCLQADSLPLGHQESHLVLSTVSLGLLYWTLPPHCQLLAWGSRDYSTQ